MNDVPSLASIRPHLTASVSAWVCAVLAGETNDEFVRRKGLKRDTCTWYGRLVAEMAGLDFTGQKGVMREAVLRMRIRELEDRLETVGECRR